MIVVGGTYAETCCKPTIRNVVGSGIRAAGVLAGIAPDTVFHTAVDDQMAEIARATAAGLGLNAEWTTRTEPVAFTYYTPLSSPSIDGRSSVTKRPIEAEAEAALVFGMVEAVPKVKARKLVFDPQQPRELKDLEISNLTAEELVIVANATETRNLGRDADLRTAASNLLASSGAKAVVTKGGAWGALVTTESGQEAVGPHPTPRVSPIGTGDVFAAALAWAWGTQGADTVEAARVASGVVAAWTSTETLPVAASAFSDHSGLEDALPPKDVRVYLASPYFTLGEQWLVDLARDSLHGLGASCFSPFHDVGPGGDEVAEADLKGIEECGSMLAIVDGNDGGTLFEVGYATKLGIPISALSTDTEGGGEYLKLLRGSGAEVHSDFSTAVYRAIWLGMGSTPLAANRG